MSSSVEQAKAEAAVQFTRFARMLVVFLVGGLVAAWALSLWIGAGETRDTLNPNLILYPSSSLHRVEPVTRGVRVASVFWTQSMVREDDRRAILFDLDMSIVRLTRERPDDPALVTLVGVYHNLLRMWTEP